MNYNLNNSKENYPDSLLETGFSIIYCFFLIVSFSSNEPLLTTNNLLLYFLPCPSVLDSCIFWNTVMGGKKNKGAEWRD